MDLAEKVFLAEPPFPLVPRNCDEPRRREAGAALPM